MNAINNYNSNKLIDAKKSDYVFSCLLDKTEMAEECSLLALEDKFVQTSLVLLLEVCR